MGAAVLSNVASSLEFGSLPVRPAIQALRKIETWTLRDSESASAGKPCAQPGKGRLTNYQPSQHSRQESGQGRGTMRAQARISPR